MMERTRWLAPLFTAIFALALGGAGSAFGQEQSFTDSDIASFARAVQDVQRIRHEYQPQIENTKSMQAVKGIQTKAHKQMSTAIKKAGLTIEQYTAISKAIPNDPDLTARVQKALNPSARARAQAKSNSPADILIRSSLPGAKALPEPSPDTPVPAWAQESYNVYLQMKRKAHGGTRYGRGTYAKMPDWSGLWTHEFGFAWDARNVNRTALGAGSAVAQQMLDHCIDFPCKDWMTADLTPLYKLRYRQKLTAVAHGFEWDQLTDCLPAGFPRMLIDPFYREYIVTPDQTWMSAETEGEFRRIYTDGRGHLPEDEAFPLWDGDSIGFWDGDTLVVHTLYMRSEELQRNQPSISREASTIERIRLIDPNTIEDDVTLYDPIALKKPWRGVERYLRIDSAHARLDMWSCASNNNVIQTEHGGSTLILPGQTVTMQRGYRNPDNVQNAAINKAIAYGAELMGRQLTEAEKAP